jgi:hypothetical protein
MSMRPCSLLNGAWAGSCFQGSQFAFILSCDEGLTGIPAPEMTEALVGRRALSVFKERGFQKLILVPDYQSLIQ